MSAGSDMQCLSSISIAAGKSFAPFTQPVYERCLQIIQSCLAQFQVYESNPDEEEEPDRTFIVVSLDLLSGLTQGLGDDIIPLIANTQPPLLHLMAICLTVSRSAQEVANVSTLNLRSASPPMLF